MTTAAQTRPLIPWMASVAIVALLALCAFQWRALRRAEARLADVDRSRDLAMTIRFLEAAGLLQHCLSYDNPDGHPARTRSQVECALSMYAVNAAHRFIAFTEKHGDPLPFLWEPSVTNISAYLRADQPELADRMDRCFEQVDARRRERDQRRAAAPGTEHPDP